ncbi:hypothetical protein FRZ67_05200 [Panacibacter ginsenosidivorans]|uniref:Zinc-binding metallo-peptidase n=1 Tax=Panacibacter ginsenosidivorans TaxID=1813871 RepID=A0A5B8V5F4_9BACT|nr:hypothetical protein FRZ67_05200 [Panacibacter ginsenosidivorans]
MARKQMDEVYRTVLGHFRHEIGHYYRDRLIENSDKLFFAFRNLFENEQIDYDEALKKHYKEGARANWNQNYISTYATAHPWEDWVETWAHYLHIMIHLNGLLIWYERTSAGCRYKNTACRNKERSLCYRRL